MNKAKDKRIPRITIGADYFRTTVRKESIYPLAWRWTKETLQNSFDAGATKFTLNVNRNERSVEVIDNGCGMDEDTLLDVFLSVGGSKKPKIDGMEETRPVGGFGDAKKIVCFCWDRWEITTRDNYLNNELIGVELQKVEPIEGTIIKVWMGDEFYPYEMIEYLNLCQVDVNIQFNYVEDTESEQIVTETVKIEKLRKNKLINDLEFGYLYANKSKPTEMLIVRLNGLALYTERIDGVHATCVLELVSTVDPKSNDYMLNVTREQLNYRYRDKVHTVILDMISNPNTALKSKKEEKILIMQGAGACSSISSDNHSEKTVVSLEIDNFIRKFRVEDVTGELGSFAGKIFDIKVPLSQKENLNNYLDTITYDNLVGLLKTANTKNNRIDALKNPVLIEVVGNSEEEKSSLQKIYPYDIIVKGSTKKRYDGVKYQRLLLAWHKTIQYVCYYNNWNDNNIDLGNYNVGFIFDEDVLAQRCVIEGVPCYLLNPSDLNNVLYTWRGIVIQLVDRASHEIAHNFVTDHNGSFVATWNSIKNWAHMYIDDLFYNVGGIIKSTQGELVVNANLDEVFSYE